VPCYLSIWLLNLHRLFITLGWLANHPPPSPLRQSTLLQYGLPHRSLPVLNPDPVSQYTFHFHPHLHSRLRSPLRQSRSRRPDASQWPAAQCGTALQPKTEIIIPRVAPSSLDRSIIAGPLLDNPLAPCSQLGGSYDRDWLVGGGELRILATVNTLCTDGQDKDIES
jgi:hypothetical protein